MGLGLGCAGVMARLSAEVGFLRIRKETPVHGIPRISHERTDSGVAVASVAIEEALGLVVGKLRGNRKVAQSGQQGNQL